MNHQPYQVYIVYCTIFRFSQSNLSLVLQIHAASAPFSFSRHCLLPNQAFETLKRQTGRDLLQGVTAQQKRLMWWWSSYRCVCAYGQVIYGGFLKWWYPTTMGFPTKNDHFGVFWGYHHLRKHPYIVDVRQVLNSPFVMRIQALFFQIKWQDNARCGPPNTFSGTFSVGVLRYLDSWNIPKYPKIETWSRISKPYTGTWRIILFSKWLRTVVSK